MTDRTPDSHPDSHPDADHDRHSDLQRAVYDTNRDVENVQNDAPPEGVDGAVGGTGGVANNQKTPRNSSGVASPTPPAPFSAGR